MTLFKLYGAMLDIKGILFAHCETMMKQNVTMTELDGAILEFGLNIFSSYGTLLVNNWSLSQPDCTL